MRIRTVLVSSVAMAVVLTVSQPLTLPVANGSATISQLGDNIEGTNSADGFGFSVALSGNGNRVVAGSTRHPSGNYYGQVRVFDWDGSSWNQVGSTITGSPLGHIPGASVSISSSGHRIAVGAPGLFGTINYPGNVFVYEWSGTSWTQLGLPMVGETAGDFFGYSVSMSADGSRVAVGAPRNGDAGIEAGSARVFEWDGTQWGQLGIDLDGQFAGDWSGKNVSLSGNGSRVIIGAPQHNSYAGHARVFEWDGTTWNQMGSDLDASVASSGFGESVSSNGDGSLVAVGAPFGNGNPSGEVRVFRWDGAQWIQFGGTVEGKTILETAGRAVSLDTTGRRLAIGAEANSDAFSGAGQVRVYDFDGHIGDGDGIDGWTQLADDIDGNGPSALLGSSVSLSPDGLRVAGGSTGVGTSTGNVRVFSIIAHPSTGARTHSPRSLEGDSRPGIFLTVRDRPGENVQLSEVTFGAFAVKPHSPYLLSIRETSNTATTRFLASGRTNTGGHLEATVKLPGLSAGSHTLVFRTMDDSGHHLSLGNIITVDASGKITSVSAEHRQPGIR